MARLPEEEIQRRLAENVERYKMSDEEALERWPDCDEKARAHKKRGSEHQKARYNTIVDDETGQRMMGGPQPKPVVTNQNIMEAVTDLADGDRQTEVIDALFAPLSRTEAAAIRGKGAERIIKIAAEQREVERRDRQELHQLGKDQLIDRLAEGILSSGLAAGLFDEMIKRQALPENVTARVSTDFDANGTAEAA